MINDLLLVGRNGEPHSSLSMQLHRLDISLLAQILHSLLLDHQVELAGLLSLQNLLRIDMPSVIVVQNAHSLQQARLVNEMQRSGHLLFLLNVVHLEIAPVLIGDALVLLHDVASGEEIQQPLLFAELGVPLQAIENFAPDLIIRLE